MIAGAAPSSDASFTGVLDHRLTTLFLDRRRLLTHL